MRTKTWRPNGQPRVVEYRRPWLYEAQIEALFTAARFSFVPASTKTGKTTGCIIWLVEQACLKGAPGREFWWVAPYHRQAEIAYERTKLYLPRGLFSYNDTKKTITLLNGAVLRYLSGEKPDTLYGDDVWAAVLDEASRMREAAYHAIRSTLTATGGPVRIIGNVKGRKNWFWRMCQLAKAGEPDMHYRKLTAYDAVAGGILPMAEVEAARRQLPPAVFQQLYLAEPADDVSNPFGPQNVQACLQVSFAPGPVVCWGIDLAKSVDYTVMVGLNAKGSTCAFHRFQLPWAETLQRIRSIVGKTQGWVDSTGVGDPVLEFLQRSLAVSNAGAGHMYSDTPLPALPPEAMNRELSRREAELLKTSLEAERRRDEVVAACPNLQGYKFTAQSKQGLLEKYAIAVQRHEVGLMPGDGGAAATVVVDEHDAFEYEYTKTGVRYSAPEGSHDDTVVAYALAWWGFSSDSTWRAGSTSTTVAV